MSCPRLNKGNIVIHESFSEAVESSIVEKLVYNNKSLIYSIPEETDVKNETSNS